MAAGPRPLFRRGRGPDVLETVAPAAWSEVIDPYREPSLYCLLALDPENGPVYLESFRVGRIAERAAGWNFRISKSNRENLAVRGRPQL
jgi:hypothetical protein